MQPGHSYLIFSEVLLFTNEEKEEKELVERLKIISLKEKYK